MKVTRNEFERLALEHLDSLDRVARSIASSPAEAEDLVQETYLRAIRAADGFELQSFGIRPWLLRILYNLHKTRAVRENRQPTLLDTEHLHAIESPPPPEPLAPMNLDGMDKELTTALDRLPPELRTVLMLWAIDELSYKEIAAVLEIPIGTVMSRLFRARRRLSERLEDFARKRGLRRE
jgi:RNA polymerase sigma-70 factor (ECF subfamily)